MSLKSTNSNFIEIKQIDFTIPSSKEIDISNKMFQGLYDRISNIELKINDSSDNTIIKNDMSAITLRASRDELGDKRPYSVFSDSTVLLSFLCH